MIGFSAPYLDVRGAMAPGDVIAFGGKGHFSRLIKWATRSPVSHVAVVIQARTVGDKLNWIAESSTGGVKLRRISQAIDTYDGEVWWLKLSEESKQRLNTTAFNDFVVSHEGKPYDDLQCWLQPLGVNSEDFDKFFCSELVSAALEAGQVISSINASEVTPIQVCRMAIYGGLWQVKGDPLELNGFNSLSAY